ncbi:hypothetical protein GCM10023166_35760 [Paeniglutamicibacter cryotolerans]
MPEARGMTLSRFSELTGISVVNLSVLKHSRAQAIRYSTLLLICDALGCEGGAASRGHEVADAGLDSLKRP